MILYFLQNENNYINVAANICRKKIFFLKKSAFEMHGM